MIINHNLAGSNAIGRMNVNSANASKSMQKLSSGLRINSAADDAAGLAISEKMRGQIRGLDQAAANSQDGISMVQTAEGALNETQSILQRMRELAVQSANDTNVSTDRGEIQKEINQLSSEINRIGNTTEFNTQKLLKGDGSVAIDKTNLFTGKNLSGGKVTNVQASVTVSMIGSAIDGDGKTFSVTLNGHTLSVSVNAVTAGASGLSSVTSNSATLNIASAVATAGVASRVANALNQIILKNTDLAGNYSASSSTTSLTIGATSSGSFAGAAGNIAAVGANAGLNAAKAASIGTTTSIQATTTVTFGAATAADVVNEGITINGQQIAFYDSHNGAYSGDAKYAVDVHGLTTATSIVAAVVSQVGSKVSGVTLTASANTAHLKVTAKDGGTDGNTISIADGGVRMDFVAKFQVGANEGQGFQVNISDMRARALGVTGNTGDSGFRSSTEVTDGTSAVTKEAALDVSSHGAASAAITKIQSAIEKVSAQRSQLGAYQNRLEHTIANLGTSSENLTSAESRIRDVDMAKEMSTFSKNNILSQAAQAMLAQANQQPQQVLQLLR